MNDKILVTGGCGFIGSHIVDELVANGFVVHVLDINQQFLNSNATYYNIDIENYNDIDKLISTLKPDVCIHLAGILGTTETWNYPKETVNININGSNNVYDACGKNACSIITVDVGSRWLSPYTITKSCSAEFALAYANKYNVKCGLLRIFNVYGPRQSTKVIKLCPIYLHKALLNEELEVWGSKNVDLIYVEDVAKAFVSAVKNLDSINNRRDIYIGSGQTILTKDFAQIVIDKVSSGKIKYCSERLGEQNISSGYMNNDTAKKLLNWQPRIPLDDGLDKTIQYYKNKNIVENYGKF
jgi:UDP-glucose 4-epimerase